MKWKKTKTTKVIKNVEELEKIKHYIELHPFEITLLKRGLEELCKTPHSSPQLLNLTKTLKEELDKIEYKK